MADKKKEDLYVPPGTFLKDIKIDFETLLRNEYIRQYDPAPFVPYIPALTTPQGMATETGTTISFEKPCSHCGKYVHTENEEIFTIGYEPNRKQKMNGAKVRVKFFHTSCFKEIAGEDFMK